MPRLVDADALQETVQAWISEQVVSKYATSGDCIKVREGARAVLHFIESAPTIGPRRGGSVTNADRIRAMPDAELAALFIGWQKKDPNELWCSTEHCPGDYKSDSFDCTDELLSGCIVRWLRQPVEDAP